MMIPIIFILIQLNGWFGYRPLNPRESAIVSVKFQTGKSDSLLPLLIDPGEGIAVETPSLRIPGNHEVDWRIRALEAGHHTLIIKADEFIFRKEIVVSNGKLVRVSPRAVGPHFGDLLLNPGEKTLAGQPYVKYIEVLYPERDLVFLGYRVDWMILFFVLSILSGFLFKGLLGVQF